MGDNYFGGPSSQLQLTVIVLTVAALSGCCSLHRPTEAELRIREQCTDITGVIRKNYNIGGNFGATVAKLGFHWASTGVVLSGEANERLIQLDYLCRQYATGKISPDEWANLQNSYIIASVKVAQGNTSPEAQQQLKENLETLRKATAELAKQRGDAPPAVPSTEEILKAAARSSNEDLRVNIERLLSKFGGDLAVDNQQLSAQLKVAQQDVAVLRAMLERTLELLSKPTEPGPIPPPITPSPTWAAATPFKVEFALNESALRGEARELLKAQLSGLKGALDYRVQLTGYTDTSGSPVLNERLSVTRAEEVRDFLVDDVGLDTSKVFLRGNRHTPSRLAQGSGGRIVEVRFQVLGPPK